MRESYSSSLAIGLEAKYRKLEQDIMADVVRRIKKAGKITSTADWQLNRMLMLGKSTSDIEKIIASAVGYNAKEVERLYEEVIANEYTIYKPQYERITSNFIPYKENYQLQQAVKAITAQTEKELSGITRSLGFMIGKGKPVYTPLSEIYNGYLDQAMIGLTSGMYDYNTLIRRVCKELTDSGLRTVDYASGWHNRVDVAARRAVLTGASQLSGKIMDMNAESLGVEKFEVSWHAGARPDHAAWQGKVYTRKQLESICGLGSGGGLLGWNCRHEYYPFFEGSERTYTDKWLEEQNAREARKKTFRGKEYNAYEATQKQRRMETNMRAQREEVQLLEEGGADSEDITIERCKYQAQLDEYKAFSRAFDLPEQRERIYYDLRGHVAPSQKEYQKWRWEKEKKHRQWLKDIGATETTLNTVDKYTEARYNRTREYILLKGYNHAVEKGDIHVLTGFTVYKSMAQEVEDKVIGLKTFDGISIDSYTTHFIDRVIGQTSTQHKGMRMGVKVGDVCDALKNGAVEKDYVIGDDYRRQYIGASCSVAVSISEQKIIQVNPV